MTYRAIPQSFKRTTVFFSKLISALFLLLTLGLNSNVFAQDYTQINRLGTGEAVCVGGVQTPEELQAVFENDSETIEQILANAGWQGNKADLDAAVAAGEFVEKSYGPGSQFSWMSARRKNTGVALPYREWNGKEAFVGYELEVASNCQVYTMVIPKICCNLSLMSTEPEPVAAPVVNVNTTEDGTVICTDPGNQVQIINEDGTVTDVALAADGCWTGTLPAGNHQVKAVNPLCGGAETVESLAVAAPLLAAAKLIPFIGLFVGSETRMRYETHWDMDMKDSSGIVGVKAGLMKQINDLYSGFGQLGYVDRNGINDGNVYPDDGWFADVGVDRKLGQKGFIGGGVGWWNFDDSDFDDTSLFIHGGSNIGNSNAQWFIEERVFADDLDEISDNNMISAGIRYLFK